MVGSGRSAKSSSVSTTVSPLGQLVALGDVAVGHLLAVGLGHPLVADPRPVAAAHLVEADVRSSVAEYSFTGMLTSPNDTAPFHSDLIVHVLLG